MFVRFASGCSNLCEGAGKACRNKTKRGYNATAAKEWIATAKKRSEVRVLSEIGSLKWFKGLGRLTSLAKGQLPGG